MTPGRNISSTDERNDNLSGRPSRNCSISRTLGRTASRPSRASNARNATERIPRSVGIAELPAPSLGFEMEDHDEFHRSTSAPPSELPANEIPSESPARKETLKDGLAPSQAQWTLSGEMNRAIESRAPRASDEGRISSKGKEKQWPRSQPEAPYSASAGPIDGSHKKARPHASVPVPVPVPFPIQRKPNVPVQRPPPPPPQVSADARRDRPYQSSSSTVGNQASSQGNCRLRPAKKLGAQDRLNLHSAYSRAVSPLSSDGGGIDQRHITTQRPLKTLESVLAAAGRGKRANHNVASKDAEPAIGKHEWERDKSFSYG
jgi:hypothetical protein